MRQDAAGQRLLGAVVVRRRERHLELLLAGRGVAQRPRRGLGRTLLERLVERIAAGRPAAGSLRAPVDDPADVPTLRSSRPTSRASPRPLASAPASPASTDGAGDPTSTARCASRPRPGPADGRQAAATGARGQVQEDGDDESETAFRRRLAERRNDAGGRRAGVIGRRRRPAGVGRPGRGRWTPRAWLASRRTCDDGRPDTRDRLGAGRRDCPGTCTRWPGGSGRSGWPLPRRSPPTHCSCC